MRRLIMRCLAIVALSVFCGGCTKSTPTPPKMLIGKGSTFVYPLMVLWSDRFERSDDGCKLDYGPYGSGSGIKGILEKKIDFACSEAPLSDEQMARGGDMLHIPLVLGAVVPVYHLPEVSETLRFSWSVLADIYRGKIKKWNDSALKELNPRVANELPNKEIIVVHRSDGSGTTYVWADYLAKVNQEWKMKVGVGTEIQWPVGVAKSGNSGVANHVKETGGSIGYVELSHAYRSDLAFGLVQNREGEFVKAGLRSVEKAAANEVNEIPSDLRFSLTDAKGKGSYPICGATWAIVHINQSPEKKHALITFLYWALEKGQEEADVLFYLRLPELLRKRVHPSRAYFI